MSICIAELLIMFSTFLLPLPFRAGIGSTLIGGTMEFFQKRFNLA